MRLSYLFVKSISNISLLGFYLLSFYCDRHLKAKSSFITIKHLNLSLWKKNNWYYYQIIKYCPLYYVLWRKIIDIFKIFVVLWRNKIERKMGFDFWIGNGALEMLISWGRNREIRSVTCLYSVTFCAWSRALKG